MVLFTRFPNIENYVVVDLMTGELIKNAFYADDDLGEYIVFKSINGKLVKEDGGFVMIRKRGFIRIMTKEEYEKDVEAEKFVNG